MLTFEHQQVDGTLKYWASRAGWRSYNYPRRRSDSAVLDGSSAKRAADGNDSAVLVGLTEHQKQQRNPSSTKDSIQGQSTPRDETAGFDEVFIPQWRLWDSTPNLQQIFDIEYEDGIVLGSHSDCAAGCRLDSQEAGGVYGDSLDSNRVESVWHQTTRLVCASILPSFMPPSVWLRRLLHILVLVRQY